MGPIVEIVEWLNNDESRVTHYELPAQVADRICDLLVSADGFAAKNPQLARELRGQARELVLAHGKLVRPAAVIQVTVF